MTSPLQFNWLQETEEHLTNKHSQQELEMQKTKSTILSQMSDDDLIQALIDRSNQDPILIQKWIKKLNQSISKDSLPLQPGQRPPNPNVHARPIPPGRQYDGFNNRKYGDNYGPKSGKKQYLYK